MDLLQSKARLNNINTVTRETSASCGVFYFLFNLEVEINETIGVTKIFILHILLRKC